MLVLAGSSLLNIALAWTFVGALGLGVRGAALGTVCASTLSCVVGLVLAARRYRVHTYRAPITACLRHLGGAQRLGLPMGVQFVFLSLGDFVLTALVAPFGAAAIAAMSVAGRLETEASRIFLDLSGAVTVLVAQRMGAGDRATVRRAVRLGIACCCVLTVVVVDVMLVLRHPIGALFTTSADVTGIVADYIVRDQ